MVIFFEWHSTTVDQKSSSGLPMTDEDTDLGALASPLVGYLGKVQERAALLQHCPWCTSKGLTYPLRSYHITLQETVTLCTNPQCLFPLVSRSLEDVLASLGPVVPTVGNKRKNPLPLEDLIKCSPKCLRSCELDSFGTQTVTETLVCQADHCVENTVSNGQCVAPETEDVKKVNRHEGFFDSQATETTGGQSLQDEGVPDEMETDKAACAEGATPSACSAPTGHQQQSSAALLTVNGDEFSLSHHCVAPGLMDTEDSRELKSHPELLTGQCRLAFNQPGFTNDHIYSAEMKNPSLQLTEHTARTEEKSQTSGIIATCNSRAGIKSETGDFFHTPEMHPEELVPVPTHLFWGNRDYLCWLDSLLVALVKCKSLKKAKPKDKPQRSSVWHLINVYEDVSAAIQDHQQTGTDGVVRVPNHVLQKAHTDLESLRMVLFKQLQPKLRCKLGQRETPVFAMPLLLTMDSWAEPLFQSTFYWEFKCSECRAATTERFVKTLPTFTNIVPDWHPLSAVHLAPCNVCCKKKQKRTMLLESVPPVFVLHFVEGLPDNNVRLYTFDFEGKRYSITMVIQYDLQLKHFVTWIRHSDESWLEYNDLKHPECKSHQKLPVPAQEMHIVFWEVEEGKEPRVCSPSSTFSDSPPTNSVTNPSLFYDLADKVVAADQQLACSPDQSLFLSHNDSNIVCALSASEDGNNNLNTTFTADTSIDSSTLLDTFEGLSHNDIITLTLVELKPDSDIIPLNDNGQTQDLTDPKKCETLDTTPDSSSTVTGTCCGPESDPPATHSSDPESGDGSSSDPTFVPCARRGRGRGTGRGKAVGRQKDKKAVSPEAPSYVSPPVSSETSKLTDDKLSGSGSAALVNTPPVESPLQTPPLVSTDSSPVSTNQKSPTRPATMDQKDRWSFMLSRHPLNHVQKSVTKPNPTHTPMLDTKVKPAPTIHSTPNPVWRQRIPEGLLPKPQLRAEQRDGLPPKAAEMYGAFSARTSHSPSPLPSPAAQSVTSHNQKSLTNMAIMSGALLAMPKANGHQEISSKKHSSKIPPGLSDTEVLRYKLMKKLKAKKKKLAKLNGLLGQQGGASLRPDSTDLSSPNTVTSSTFDGSTCDSVFSDLLSPATTVSNLSPDSTGYLEMLVTGQDGVNQLDCGVNGVGGVLQTENCVNGNKTENFMDEFLMQAMAQRPTEMESEALSALELFI